MKIAYVKWLDSTSQKKVKHGEESSGGLDHIENAGIIVHETFGPDGYIKLAFYSNWDQDHYTETITIPKFACSRKVGGKIKRVTVKG